VENNDNIQSRRFVEDAMKENREDRILLGGDFDGRIGERGEKGEGGWEKKIQRQGGKRRREETEGMDRRKWMNGIEREQTRGGDDKKGNGPI
jgi:hypothetical protein